MTELVEFKASELNQIPAELWPLTQKFPIPFDRYFEHLGGHGEPQSDRYEIYFDNETEPAIAFEGGVVKDANESGDDTPGCISIYKDGVMVYFEVGEHILLDERSEDFPELSILGMSQ
jgi:hypothetical protein